MGYPSGVPFRRHVWQVQKIIQNTDKHNYSEVTTMYYQRIDRNLDQHLGYFHNDIALLYLATPIALEEWERYYVPAKLPNAPLFEGGTCFGARHFAAANRTKRSAEITFWSQRQSKHITMCQFLVVPLKLCRTQQEQRRGIFGDEARKESAVDESWLCLERAKVTGNFWNKCLGDRGSILMCNGVLWGISSWGAGCVAPGRLELWTRIDRHLTWISEVIDGKRSFHQFGSNIPEASLKEWRILVSLRSGSNEHQCAGLLVRPDLVLASASCVEQRLEEDALQGLTLIWGTEDVMQPIQYVNSARLDILQIQLHRNYLDWQNDIAILPLPYDIKDIPVAQLGDTQLNGDVRCWTGSWHTRLPISAKINSLVLLRVRLLKMQDCVSYYRDISDIDNLESQYYCTMAISSWRDDCLVEQGAPLICGGKVFGWGVRRYGCKENITWGAPTLWWRMDVGNRIFDSGWRNWWPRRRRQVEVAFESIENRPVVQDFNEIVKIIPTVKSLGAVLVKKDIVYNSNANKCHTIKLVVFTFDIILIYGFRNRLYSMIFYELM